MGTIISMVVVAAVTIAIICWQVKKGIKEREEEREEESIKRAAEKEYPNDLKEREKFERLLRFNLFHTKKRAEATKRGEPYPGNGLGIPDQMD